METTEKEHYRSIDGLRTIACIGIMMMHIQANTQYVLSSNFVWSKLIPSCTNFVYLFMMISGFGMCAGYLNRFLDGTIQLEAFYRRRYAKILPYFVFLIIIALVYEPSLTNFYDATLEVMLIYGLLPNAALNVIGVGWTLGVIFVFYFLFPPFSILLKTKRRAWIFFLLSLWVNFICSRYYFSERFMFPSFPAKFSIIWCLPFFITGGGDFFV